MTEKYVEPEWVGEAKRTREMIEMWQAKRAKEGPAVYRKPDEVRPPDLGKAIKRRMTSKKVRRK